MKRLRIGLAFKAHRLLHHSTLGLRVKKKRRSLGRRGPFPRNQFIQNEFFYGEFSPGNEGGEARLRAVLYVAMRYHPPPHTSTCIVPDTELDIIHSCVLFTRHSYMNIFIVDTYIHSYRYICIWNSEEEGR